MNARTLAALLALATTTFGMTASAQDDADDDDAPAPVAAAPTPATTIPIPAWSATNGAEDVVVLRDGGAIRGLLMEVLPNDHASVKLADGRTAIIPWVLIHHIEQGSHPAKAPAPTPAPVVPSTGPNTASAPIEHPAGSVLVHMTGSENATLQTQRAGAWTTVCASPCDQTLPLDAYYRIDGSGVRTSSAFHLQGKAGDRVSLDVNAASSGGFSGGITMAVLGGLAVSVGFWGVYGTAIANAPTYSYNYYDGTYDNSPSHHYSYAPWLVTAGVGAVVGTVGLVMAVKNEKTTFVQNDTAAKSAKLEPLPDRSPTFFDRKPVGFVEPQTAPVFSMKF